MSDVRIELNRAGVGELLRSEEIRAIVEEHAAGIAQSLGDGYEYSTGYGAKDGRVRSYVHAKSKKAIKENLENNTMLKEVGNHAGNQNN